MCKSSPSHHFWMTKPSRYGRGFEPRRDRLTAASGEHALCHPPSWSVMDLNPVAVAQVVEPLPVKEIIRVQVPAATPLSNDAEVSTAWSPCFHQGI